jgi:TetR/AcrR family transcriptional regulator
MSLRTRLKAEDRRKQLLGIAKKLFAGNGFENTTTKAIAAEAGVSEAIIFRHFASKEELYANILDQKADEIGIRTWGAELSASAAKTDDEALVFSVVKHILEADRKDPEFRKLMLQAALSGHPLHKITANRLLPLHRFLCRYIIKRQKQDAFQKCDPKLAANAIIGVPSYCGLSGILFDMDDVRLPEEQKAWSITRLIIEGIRFHGKSLPKKRYSKAAIKGRKA